MQEKELEKHLMKPTTRRRLGKYVILGRIGAGGMGKIYLAFLPGPGSIEKLVVIKRLHSHLVSDELLVNSFLDEARLSMALSHPNIVHTFDVGSINGRYFMTMEYVDGKCLSAIMRASKRGNKYPHPNLWAGMYVSVLDALHAAHIAVDARGRALNIIHRDISPQNILISYEGTPKLVDFGIAKAAMRINETDAGVLKGKYAYMSPEQCRASDKMDPRSDIFSAGIVFWELLAGRRLYKSKNMVQSIERILKEAPPSPIKYNAECPQELADITIKALQKKPEDRFQSAEAFKEAIEDYLLKKQIQYRRSDLKTLMHDIFGDVIAKQRTLINNVLEGNFVAAEDNTQHGMLGDSQIDTRIPNLLHGLENDSTTPSSIASSVFTPKNTMERSLATKADKPINILASQHNELSQILAQTTYAQNSQRNLFLAIFPWLMIGILSLAIIFGIYTWTTSVSNSKSTTNTKKTVPAASQIVEKEALKKEALKKEALKKEALKEEALKEEALKEEKLKKEALKKEALKKEKLKSVKKQKKKKSKKSKKKAIKKAEKKPVVIETGFLSLYTSPWTDVYYKGKNIGTTPIQNVKLPVGRIQLLLKNKSAGIEEHYFVKINKNKLTRKRLGLE